MDPWRQFRDDMSTFLKRNRRTLAAQIPSTTTPVIFVFPNAGATRWELDAWRYLHVRGKLEMVFGFAKNARSYSLMTRVVELGDDVNNQGATIQFNKKYCFVREGPRINLRHRGVVTVLEPMARAELQDRIRATTTLGYRLLVPTGRWGWPRRLGASDDFRRLLDELFLYSYCVEQAKRARRGDPQLPPL